jgi:hypothetical protein
LKISQLIFKEVGLVNLGKLDNGGTYGTLDDGLTSWKK